MKRTPFYDCHVAQGAKMVPFAGHELPIEYEGIKAEHLAVRQKCGVFDVSHMGEFFVNGPKAFDLVQKLTSNDVAALSDGTIQYSTLTNEKGGIVDDLLVYRINEEKYLLVVNGANVEKDWAHCAKYAEELGMKPGVDLVNESPDICQLAIQGPLALKAMNSLCEFDLEEMTYYTFKIGEFAGIKDAIVSITGYTGSGGCEVYVKNEYAKKLWDAVLEAGKEYDLIPCGLGARDTLRLEAGFCLYGNDLDDEHSPIQAGLGWLTKFVEGNNFIGREIIEDHKTNNPPSRLKPFVLSERGIPRKDYEVVNAEGEKIGVVTSGTVSPLTGKAIGFAYMQPGYYKVGTEIYIQIRKKQVKAEIVKLPFYDK
ncbi:aminomethyltransferase [Balneicella halophila]|uniref:Aminomethyltransferase n=1 Tax=Balneicella halophila TaxID=1537566 RepID=A0A7L4USG9_BALHA|nr:glycine cleavage system aminomethyltransferase GcvT [Balneicella halophila]PVX52452.1 aminomethyltransferase [Balneicella halophila]